MSERMLAQTLQWLEGDGLVTRTAYNEVPPRVEYSLTALGQEAAAQVRSLADWIEVNLPRIQVARNEAADPDSAGFRLLATVPLSKGKAGSVAS